MQQSDLPAGIPSNAEYQACLKTDLLREMGSFSEAFLRRNRIRLLHYSLRWSDDPLHHPTRQWEYPFTFQRLTATRARRVLDAGSGVTFFPYFLRKKIPTMQVACCDRDEYIGNLYKGLERTEGIEIPFEHTDLSRLPFQDGSFDAIYCISVLEHTGNYRAIVSEFRRVLAKAGRLLVTFDVSLDGTKDIPVDRAEELLGILGATLTAVEAPSLQPMPADVFVAAGRARARSSSAFWTCYRTAVRLMRTAQGRSSGDRSRMTVYCGEYCKT